MVQIVLRGKHKLILIIFIQIEVGRGPQMTLTREPPPSPVRMDQQVILIPCHWDIVGGLVKSVLRLYLKLDTNTVNRRRQLTVIGAYCYI